MYDVIIVGSGPAGLSCALTAQNHGLRYVLLEKGTITDSIYNYPISMVFFTTRELIEIGNYPLNIYNIKPNREEALHYYAKFVQDNKINVNTHEKVLEINGADKQFTIKTQTIHNKINEYSSKKVILATGVFDNPRMLNVVGEDLPHVSHYYKERHPYVGKNVLIVGGRNSAAEAALDIYRSGGNVTISLRDNEFKHLKYWLEPDILNRVKEKTIACHYESEVIEIKEASASLRLKDGSELEIPVDFVLALTGYQPNGKLLRSLGVHIDADSLKPEHNPDTFETNVPGVYIAGVLTAGNDSSKVFIENGRFHGEHIIPSLKKTL